MERLKAGAAAGLRSTTVVEGRSSNPALPTAQINAQTYENNALHQTYCTAPVCSSVRVAELTCRVVLDAKRAIRQGGEASQPINHNVATSARRGRRSRNVGDLIIICMCDWCRLGALRLDSGAHDSEERHARENEPG